MTVDALLFRLLEQDDLTAFPGSRGVTSIARERRMSSFEGEVCASVVERLDLE
jgi:hypothetical protein